MYCEQPVAELLGQWVECRWHVSGGSGRYAVPPDGCVDIVYSSSVGLSVVGAMTRERSFTFPAGEHLAGVRFRPGMAKTLLGGRCPGFSAAELTDEVAPLQAIWGVTAREALRRLDDKRSSAACGTLLQDLLRPVEARNPVQRALAYAASHHGMINLDWVACQSSLSIRQFRRRCLEESGLTPKRLCRILRFRYARGLAVAARCPDWADIAVQSGYCDQAHLIRDFREFTGRTPMSVLSNLPGAQLD
ncbi:MAG TPA: AraC family transcriptional regulator [Bryobacteraceae bacterium]|jgi:AraC-like DNA-binding protein|nr:AraC family transcriptional regulator [Bryobacteraceae bacterium]